MIKNTISQRANLPGQAYATCDAQDPDILQQGNRNQQTRETVGMLELRQSQVEAACFDVREQFLTSEPASVIAQRSRRRAKIGGNKPGIIAGLITGQGKMDWAVIIRFGQANIGQIVRCPRFGSQGAQLDPTSGWQINIRRALDPQAIVPAMRAHAPHHVRCAKLAVAQHQNRCANRYQVSHMRQNFFAFLKGAILHRRQDEPNQGKARRR